jgi:hypothetical protein
VQLAILSDIHYAGSAERQRAGYPVSHVTSRIERVAITLYRNHFWQRDPFAHNHLLDEFIAASGQTDLVVANGDYSCDSAAIGVADDAACASASECLAKMRNAFRGRFEATIGDHELGKKALGGDKGGLRIESLLRTQSELQLKPFWQRQCGNYLLMGVTSSLIAFPIYAPEALPDERPRWENFREQHLQEIRSAFSTLAPDQRVLLFCHDPTALPFLARDEVIGGKLNQIERTIIGHLHSRLIFIKSRLLAGMPVIRFLGHTPLRLSSALHEARFWKPFKVLLCPSLAGIELLKDGGFYTCELGASPLRFEFHRLKHSPECARPRAQRAGK